MPSMRRDAALMDDLDLSVTARDPSYHALLCQCIGTGTITQADIILEQAASNLLGLCKVSEKRDRNEGMHSSYGDCSKDLHQVLSATSKRQTRYQIKQKVEAQERKPRHGRKADPRMARAVAAKLKDQKMSNLEALQKGGFIFAGGSGTKAVEAYMVDPDGVTLAQRKNQLCRRIRQLRERQQCQHPPHTGSMPMSVQGSNKTDHKKICKHATATIPQTRAPQVPKDKKMVKGKIAYARKKRVQTKDLAKISVGRKKKDFISYRRNPLRRPPRRRVTIVRMD